MAIERTHPLAICAYSARAALGLLGQALMGNPRPLFNLCLRSLDFECQETAGYLRHIELTDLFPESPATTVLSYTPLDRGAASLTFDESVHLTTLVTILQPKSIFEIGTFRGHTTRTLARNLPAGGRIFTLDLPHDQYGAGPLSPHSSDLGNVRLSPDHKPDIGDLYKKDPEIAARVTQLLGSSDAFDYSPYLGKIDLFFIDGAHSYDYVKNDTEKALACLAPGGVVIWHDLKGGFRGMVRFFEEFGANRELHHLKGTSLVAYWPRGVPSRREMERAPAA